MEEARAWAINALFSKSVKMPYTKNDLIELDHRRIYNKVISTKDLFLLKYGQAICIEYLRRHQVKQFRSEFGCVWFDQNSLGYHHGSIRRARLVVEFAVSLKLI